nr:telomere associated protein RIF1 [Hymenolepis microstoma]
MRKHRTSTRNVYNYTSYLERIEKPSQFRKRLDIFIVAVLDCMGRLDNIDFSVECIGNLLCKIESASISDPSIIISAFVKPSLLGKISEILPSDAPTNEHLFHFVTELIKACSGSKSKPSDFVMLLKSFINFIPSCKYQTQPLLKTIDCLLESASYSCREVFKELSEEFRVIVLFVMRSSKPEMDFAINVLRNCAKTCPRVFIFDAVFDTFIRFMIGNLNISTTVAEEDTKNPMKIFSVYSDLIKQLQSDETVSDLMTPEKYFSLFDPLRVLPINETHSACRLYTWWIFLCFLPEKILSSGSNRYMTPFLANLIGRYMSVNECLGNRFTTKYKLSSASVYNNSPAAQNLAMHVFACFFDYPQLCPLSEFEGETLPKLTLSAEFLAERGYTLLVALLHWLRYLCGVGDLPGNQTPSSIWSKCLHHIRSASTKANNSTIMEEFLAQCVVKLSTKLLSPHSLLIRSPNNVINIPPSDISSNPEPSDCMAIFNDVYNLVINECMPEDLKSPHFSSLCHTALELISTYSEKCNSSASVNGSIKDIINGLGEAVIELFNKDSRLSSARGNGIDRVALLRSYINALCSDCVAFISQLPKDLEDFSPSPSLKIHTIIVNEMGLSVWSVMVDCFIKLVIQHEVLTDSGPNGPNEGPNLTTLFSFLLAPIFLAGNTEKSPSPSVECETLRRMFNLFRAFRQEATSLTVLAVNSTINRLSLVILALMQSLGNGVKQTLNLRIIANLLVLMAESADISEDIVHDESTVTPSQWKLEKGRLLDYMLGPVEAVSYCLNFMPLEHHEMSISNSVVSFSSQEQEIRSRSPLTMRSSLSHTLSPSNIFEEVVIEFSQIHQQSPKFPQSVTRNLLFALWTILRRNKSTKENIFVLIGRCSSGLLALSKHLELIKPATKTIDEALVIIVSAYEAFVTATCNWILKNHNKPCVVDVAQTLKTLEIDPLVLPHTSAKHLLVFFEAAVHLASCPISSVTYRIGKASKKALMASASFLQDESADCTVDVSKRHKVFIYCLATIWDTLVTSLDVEDTEIRNRIIDVSTQFSACLASLSVPQISLHSRQNFPSWIPHEKLIDRVEQVQSRISENLENIAPREEEEFENPYFYNGDSLPEINQQVVADSSLKHGIRIGTRKFSLPGKKIPLLPHRRLSLADLCSRDQDFKGSAGTSGSPGDVKTPPRSVPNMSATNVMPSSPVAAAVTTRKVIETTPVRGRKRKAAADRMSTNTIDFEDSSDFVFIPPKSTPSAKRMRLTEHQKERMREQRQAYIPPMFNSLDRDSNDAIWALYPSDSQSSMDSNSRPPFDRSAPTLTQSQPKSETSTSNGLPNESRSKTPNSTISDTTNEEANSGFEEETPVRLTVTQINKAPFRKRVIIQSKLLPDSDITNPNSIKKTRLMDMPASPSAASPMLAASPMMSPQLPLLRSPGLLNSRTLKILENSRAEIEKKQKLRMAQLASMNDEKLQPTTTPLPSPAIGSFGSPPRTGILRESMSNRVKHVSFADQATVIVIHDSPPESPNKEELLRTPTKSVSPAPPAQPTLSSTAPLNVETGVLDSSENSRILLSPLAQIQGKPEEHSPSTSLPSVSFKSVAANRRRKSDSPRRLISRPNTRQQTSKSLRSISASRKRFFASHESRSMPVLSAKKASPVALTSTTFPPSKISVPSTSKPSFDTEVVEGTQMSPPLQGTTPTTTTTDEDQNLNLVEVIEETQDIPEDAIEVPSSVQTAEMIDAAIPDVIADTPFEEIVPKTASTEVSDQPKSMDVCEVAGTNFEATSLVPQESSGASPKSSEELGEGIRLERIKQALRTVGEELPSLTREQQKNMVMEIIALLHPFCSS